MSRPSSLFLFLVAGLIPVLPASGQPVPKLKPAEKAQAEKAAKAPAAPVIACPSVANYRMLMQGGPSAAAATLNDPKADHLGCAALPRNRIGSVVDRVTLAATPTIARRSRTRPSAIGWKPVRCRAAGPRLALAGVAEADVFRTSQIIR